MTEAELTDFTDAKKQNAELLREKAEHEAKLREQIRDKVRSVTGMNCIVELVPPRTLPRTSSGKMSRAKARNLYLSGEIQPYAIAA
jgi:fatty-acyl-CoA synthase